MGEEEEMPSEEGTPRGGGGGVRCPGRGRGQASPGFVVVVDCLLLPSNL